METNLFALYKKEIVMILHGVYNNGVIKINDENPPMITAEVEIILKDRPWQKRLKKVKIRGESLSETIIRARYEESRFESIFI